MVLCICILLIFLIRILLGRCKQWRVLPLFLPFAGFQVVLCGCWYFFILGLTFSCTHPGTDLVCKAWEHGHWLHCTSFKTTRRPRSCHTIEWNAISWKTDGNLQSTAWKFPSAHEKKTEPAQKTLRNYVPLSISKLAKMWN